MNRMLSTRAEIALAITREAGDLARHWFDKSTLRVDTKSDGSPVTQADQEIEQMIRDALSENFPDDGIMGEEFDDVVGSSGNRWIIDPIDGTKSFVHSVPLYANLLAYEEAGEITFGAINLPAPVCSCQQKRAVDAGETTSPPLSPTGRISTARI